MLHTNVQSPVECAGRKKSVCEEELQDLGLNCKIKGWTVRYRGQNPMSAGQSDCSSIDQWEYNSTRSKNRFHRWEEQTLLMGRNRAMRKRMRGRNIAMRKNVYADEKKHVATGKLSFKLNQPCGWNACFVNLSSLVIAGFRLHLNKQLAWMRLYCIVKVWIQRGI